MPKTQPSKEIRDTLISIGKSHQDIAHELGVDLSVVRGVVYGRLKGVRGDAHKVAVALGMKGGIIVDDAASIVDAIKEAKAVKAAKVAIAA